MLRKTGVLTRPNLSTPPVLRSVEACGSSCGFCTSRSFWNDAPRKEGLATLLKTMIRPGQGREACIADSSLSGREPPQHPTLPQLVPSLPSVLPRPASIGGFLFGPAQRLASESDACAKVHRCLCFSTRARTAAPPTGMDDGSSPSSCSDPLLASFGTGEHRPEGNTLAPEGSRRRNK